MPYAHHQCVSIHYEVEGEGPPLVLHHGAFGNLEVWHRRGFVDGLKNSHKLILGPSTRVRLCGGVGDLE